jgi:hypothetical protein
MGEKSGIVLTRFFPAAAHGPASVSRRTFDKKIGTGYSPFFSFFCFFEDSRLEFSAIPC